MIALAPNRELPGFSIFFTIFGYCLDTFSFMFAFSVPLPKSFACHFQDVLRFVRIMVASGFYALSMEGVHIENIKENFHREE